MEIERGEIVQGIKHLGRSQPSYADWLKAESHLLLIIPQNFKIPSHEQKKAPHSVDERSEVRTRASFDSRVLAEALKSAALN